jgi:lipoprotein-anchoring transpeptidase ErfK/SrfK
MRSRLGGASRVMMTAAGALLAVACEVRTLPEQDSATAAAQAAPTTDTVAGTVTTTPGTTTVASSPGALPGDSTASAASGTAVPGSAVSAPGAPAPGAPASGSSASAVAGSDMRLEVNISERKVHVFRGGQETGSYPVAVGSAKWPTQRGEWTVKQVIFNPAWVPPDESWADEREPKDPGAPDNPLGRAQLVYDPPRTIHGTNQPKSIGTATSHGSIRMTNETIVELAKQVMQAAGAPKDDAWVQRALANRREKQVVDLPRPVPIRVY